jgi:lysozyme family protein
MPIVIGYQVFDMGVNHGVNMAARTLQKAVGVVVDGNIGPITLAAINKLDPNRLAMLLCAARLSYYTALSTWASFGKGWTNRIAHILGVVSK